MVLQLYIIQQRVSLVLCKILYLLIYSFYCSVAKADDSDTNIIELYDYETGQTSNVYIPNNGTSTMKIN